MRHYGKWRHHEEELLSMSDIFRDGPIGGKLALAWKRTHIMTSQVSVELFLSLGIRVARSQKIKKAKFGHKQFQKGQILKWWKRPKKAKFSKKIYQNMSKIFWNYIKCCMFCCNLAKIGLKRYYFLQDWKKAKKRPNGQIILFLENCFKKGQMATLLGMCLSLGYNFP